MFLIMAATCFATTTYLSADIGGAKPGYSYDDFLITSFPTSEFSQFDLKEAKPAYRTTISQGYYLGNIISTGVYYADSLLSLDVQSFYKDSIYFGKLSVGVLNNQYLNYRYYNYPHKQNIRASNFHLENRIRLSSGSRNSGNLFLNNSFEYTIHHSQDSNIDLSGEANQSSLYLAFDNSLISLDAALPLYHNRENYRIAMQYARQRKLSPKTGRFDSFLTGAGFSLIRSSYDDGFSFFPQLHFRMNLHTGFLVSVKLQESFSQYPLQSHFEKNRLLWKSRIPFSEEHLQPIKARTADITSELRIGETTHLFRGNYTHSPMSRSYEWDTLLNSFSIETEAKKQETVTLNYKFSFFDSAIAAETTLPNNTDFLPAFSLTTESKLSLNLFNSFGAGITYNHQESFLDGTETHSYTTFRLTYGYSNLRNRAFEAGIYYSTLTTESSYWKDSPAFWITLSIGV